MTLKRTSRRLFAVVGIVLVSAMAHAADKKPNILVIWGDDIGIENISYNNRGMMGLVQPDEDAKADRSDVQK
jgi:arylsulfatase